ncbi:MAG: hypothetical protein ACRD36_10450, partial [Candidatus Acidiferrum sp.]
YLNKWRPLRNSLPGVAAELEALGLPRSAKFDAILEQAFAAQLTGRGKTPEEREKILRKLSGIKEAPKKKEKEKKPAKHAEKSHTQPAHGEESKKKNSAAARKITETAQQKHDAGAGKHAPKQTAKTNRRGSKPGSSKKVRARK